MTPSSQGVEPATFPERFKVVAATRSVFLLGKLSPSLRRSAWYSLALLETAIAAVLVTVVESPPRIAAVSLFITMSVFGLLALQVAPESTCGCFGADTRVSWRTVGRSGLLALIAGSTLLRSDLSLRGGAASVGALLVAEVVALLWLSLPTGIRTSIRHLRYRLRTPPCLTSNEPLGVTVDRLRASRAWETLTAYVADAAAPHLLDHWREGCWRFLAFAATGDEQAQVVFAVHLPPGRVSYSGALVLADGTTAATAASRERRWRRYRRSRSPIGQAQHSAAGG
jgi:hypothetical protein